MSEIEFNLVLLLVGFGLALLLRLGFTRVVVGPNEAVLAVRNGRDLGRLATGVHYIHFGDVTIERFDLRETIQKVGGQEVLTRDRVPVKFTVIVRHRVADPLAVRDRVQDIQAHVHAATQLALRSGVALLELDELLGERASLSDRLEAPIQEALAVAGLELVQAAVQDVMVGGDLKRAFGDVARARAEGLAKLERARGDAASLRKLANAARLFEEHAGLDRLKTLEVAARAAEGHGNTLVLGLDDRARALRER